MDVKTQPDRGKRGVGAAATAAAKLELALAMSGERPPAA
jgi:hypothetical protein